MIQRQGKLARRKSQGFLKQDLRSVVDEYRLILRPVWLMSRLLSRLAMDRFHKFHAQ